jgi:hypothetical protein
MPSTTEQPTESPLTILDIKNPRRTCVSGFSTLTPSVNPLFKSLYTYCQNHDNDLTILSRLVQYKFLSQDKISDAQAVEKARQEYEKATGESVDVRGETGKLLKILNWNRFSSS